MNRYIPIYVILAGLSLSGCEEVTAAYDMVTGHSTTLAEAVYDLGLAYKSAAAEVQGVVEAKLITDRATLETIRSVNDKTHDAIAQAVAAEKVGANNAVVLFNAARAVAADFEMKATTAGIQMPAQATLPAALPLNTPIPAPAPKP